MRPVTVAVGTSVTVAVVPKEAVAATVLAGATNAAVTVAVWVLLTAPAVAVNTPLLPPDAMPMVAGTLSVVALLDKLTVSAACAARFSVTVQEALCPADNTAGIHPRLEICSGGVRVNANVREAPLAAAVRVAV